MTTARKILFVLIAFATAASPICAQGINKLRVLSAPGVTKSADKDWHNTLTVSGKDLDLSCPKCSPVQKVDIPENDIATLRYGQNAYHHWVAGIITGVFSLGAGLVIGLMHHHKHYFSIDTKEGKVLAIQADKGNYRQIAGMLENLTGLPILVTTKDAHFLHGYNTKIQNPPPQSK